MGPLSVALLVVLLASLLFPPSRRLLASLVRHALVQLVLVGVLVAVGSAWVRYNAAELADLDSLHPANLVGLTSAKVLTSTGAAVFVCGFVYRCLPIDLIPDFLPVVGTLDDLVAGMWMGVGVAMVVFGYRLGHGPVPEALEWAVDAAGSAWGEVQPHAVVAAGWAQQGWAQACALWEQAKPYW